MAFIPQYYPNMYHGGYHSMYNPRWNLGQYQFGGNMGDFFNYFKDLYPTLKGFQGQSAGQSNLYSDEAQKYYKDLLNKNWAVGKSPEEIYNDPNSPFYSQEYNNIYNDYTDPDSFQDKYVKEEGLDSYAYNDKYEQAEAAYYDNLGNVVAGNVGEQDARFGEPGAAFKPPSREDQLLETGANIFSLMRGQEAYNQRAPEQNINIQNTGHKGFKYQKGGSYYDVSKLAPRNGSRKNPKMQLGGKPFNNLINTTGYTRGANTFNNPFNIIPGGNITMKNVDEPILAMPSNSRPIVMEPGKDYNFPGASYVIEQRLNTMKNGGKTKMYQKGGDLSYKDALNLVLDEDDDKQLYYRGYFGYPEGTEPDKIFRKAYEKKGIKGLKAALKRDGYANYRKEKGDNSIKAQLNTIKYAFSDALPFQRGGVFGYQDPALASLMQKRVIPYYQLGGAGIQGNVQRAMFNNRFGNNPPPQLAQGFFNPFMSVPQSDLNNRLYIQQMAGNQTQPTVAPVPVAPRIMGLVPSYAMERQGYIDGLEIMYNNNPANADDQIARSRYKDDGTKDKRFKKQYTKGYGNQVQILGLSNRDQVKEMQKAMGMTGKEVDGIWGPKTQMAFDMWSTDNMPSDAYVLPKTPVDANGVPLSTLQPTVTDQYGNVATKPDLTPEQQAMWDYNFDRTMGLAGSALVDGLSAGYVAKNPYVGAGVGLLSAAEQGLVGTNVIGSAANLAAMGKMGMGAARVGGKAISKGTKLASGLYQGTKQGLVTLSKTDKKQFVDKGKYLIDETGAVFTKAGKKIKNGTAASKRAVADFFKTGKSVKVQDYEKSFTGQDNLSYGLYRDAKGRIQKIKDTRGGLQKILEGDFKNPFRGAKGYTGKPIQRSSNPTNYATFFRYGGEVTFENPFK